MGIIEKWNLVEKRPAPLNLSDKEILDWLNEMRPILEWQNRTDHGLDGVWLDIPEISVTFGRTIEVAVCLAAAKWKESNQ